MQGTNCLEDLAVCPLHPILRVILSRSEGSRPRHPTSNIDMSNCVILSRSEGSRPFAPEPSWRTRVNPVLLLATNQPPQYNENIKTETYTTMAEKPDNP